METIDEAAKDYADKYFERSGNCEAKLGFKAGVVFAQQWVSVEDEIPEDDERVLVKGYDGEIHVGVIEGRSGDYAEWHIENCGFIIAAKFWRRIKLI